MPGKQLVVANTLSRNPLTHLGKPDTEEDVIVIVQTVLSTKPVNKDKINAIRKATQEDSVLQSFRKYVLQGWPSHMYQLPYSLHGFHTVKAH